MRLPSKAQSALVPSLFKGGAEGIKERPQIPLNPPFSKGDFKESC